MFSKADKSRLLWAEAIDQLRQSPEAAERLTIVGAQLTVRGDIDCPGSLQIFGVVEGDVRAGTLIIEAGAHIEGKASADRAVIAGSVNGPVTATDIRIESTAKVIGNITHNMLTIEPGAFLEGRRPWRPRPAKG
jgi:cytoskeletal protein CcmA (bactofilin family)